MVVDRLVGLFQQAFGSGKPAGESLDGARAVAQRAVDRGTRPPFDVEDLGPEVGAHGNRHFRRRGGGRRAAVGGEVDQRRIRLVPDGGDQGDFRSRRGPDHRFLVEGPEVFQTAAAAGHDQHVRSWNRTAGGQPVEARDRFGDANVRPFPLDRHGPQDHAPREAVGEPVQNVANHRAGRRGDDTDDVRQEGNVLLALFFEQALGCEPLAPVLEQLEKGALPRELDRFDDDLITRAARIGRDAAGADDLHALFELEPQPAHRAAPADAVERRRIVLQREIEMPGAVIVGPPHLAPHAHMLEISLERALHRLRNFADRIFADVAFGRRQRGHLRHRGIL